MLALSVAACRRASGPVVGTGAGATGGGDSIAFARVTDSLTVLESAIRKGGAGEPMRLIELGRLKRRAEQWMADSGVGVPYARAHTDEYSYDEIGGQYLYRGTQFQEVLRRFPAGEAAEQAAYELLILTSSQDCEGSVTCELEHDFAPALDFLITRPRSRFVPLAVGRANQALTSALADYPDLTRPDAEGLYSPFLTRSFLVQYQETATLLPAASRAAANATLASLWERFHEYDRAKHLRGWRLEDKFHS